MSKAIISVKPAGPDAVCGGRKLLADLVAAATTVKKPGWHQLAVFSDKPRRAYWYSSRLKSHGSLAGFEFSATTVGGAGTLFCRLAPAATSAGG